MSHIIYHAYYSKQHNQQAYCFNNVKASYMLDFNEVFWPADKREKHAENAENSAENCGF